MCQGANILDPWTMLPNVDNAIATQKMPLYDFSDLQIIGEFKNPPGSAQFLKKYRTIIPAAVRTL